MLITHSPAFSYTIKAMRILVSYNATLIYQYPPDTYSFRFSTHLYTPQNQECHLLTSTSRLSAKCICPHSFCYPQYTCQPLLLQALQAIFIFVLPISQALFLILLKIHLRSFHIDHPENNKWCIHQYYTHNCLLCKNSPKIKHVKKNGISYHYPASLNFVYLIISLSRSGHMLLLLGRIIF